MSAGSKRSFRLPLKKTGVPGIFFAAFSLDFLCAGIWPPGAYGRKGGRYADITGFKVDCEKARDREKSSHGKAFAGTGRANRKYGKWRRGTAFGIPGRICDLSDRKICHGLSVHSCGDYCYENNGQQICVDASFFEQREWYMRLFLEGEDRLAKNRESSRKGKIVSYHAVSEEWFFLASPALPPLEQLIEKEKIMELMELLTERQRNIVILYFYYGETQWEIAKALGVSQPTVSQTLMAALRRMREGQEEIVLEKRAGSGRCAV